MVTLLQSITVRQLLLEQAPIFAMSLVIAEIFYKFHSFMLECIGFIATWYVLDASVKFLREKLNYSRGL